MGLHGIARSARLVGAFVCLVPFFGACTASSEGTSGSPNDETNVDGGRSTDTDSSKPTKDEPVTAKSACEAFAKSRCAKEKGCNAFRFAALWGDEPACQKRMQIGCVERFDEPGVTWKPAGLDACAKAIAGAACDDLYVEKLPSACTPTPGTIAADETCAHDAQCATGFCKMPSFGGCGTCDERAGAFGACTTNNDCEPGLACVQRRCSEIAKEGGSCSRSTPCAYGYVCNDGTCERGAPEGTRCADTPTSPDLCDQANGVFCSTILMTCKKIELASIGAPCDPYQNACAGGGVCDFGTCVAPLGEGDACTVTGDRQCGAPFVCELGKCILPTAETCAQ